MPNEASRIASQKSFVTFLHGIELITKQLNDVLESLGITAIEAVGQKIRSPHSRSCSTEPSEEYEPDTVTEEIARGYKHGRSVAAPVDGQGGGSQGIIRNLPDNADGKNYWHRFRHDKLLRRGFRGRHGADCAE
jgi:hypothetical protein